MRNGFCRGKYICLWPIRYRGPYLLGGPPLAFQGLRHLVGFIALRRAVTIYPERTNPPQPRLPRRGEKKGNLGLIIKYPFQEARPVEEVMTGLQSQLSANSDLVFPCQRTRGCAGTCLQSAALLNQSNLQYLSQNRSIFRVLPSSPVPTAWVMEEA